MLTLICPRCPALQHWHLSWQEVMPPSPPRHAPPQQAGARRFCSTHWPIGMKERQRKRENEGQREENKRDEVRQKANIKCNQWGIGGERQYNVNLISLRYQFGHHHEVVLILRKYLISNHVYIPNNDIPH